MEIEYYYFSNTICTEFEIDLIVWKYYNPNAKPEYITEFEIDLIVWK